MAPVTRSKLTQASEPATSSRTSSTKSNNSKPQASSKPNSVSTVSQGSVQKSKKSKGKGKKPASRASSRPITIRSSSASSKFKSKSKAVPPIALDDFPELAQAYTIFPYLDSPEFNVPYAGSRCSLQRPGTPPFANVRSLRSDEGSSAPSSYRTGSDPILRLPVPSVATRSSRKRSNSSSVQSGKKSDWAKAARVASPQPTLKEQARSLSKRSKGKKKATTAQSKQKVISLLSSEESASSPSAREAQRPTVADVRRERLDWAALLRYWAMSMQRAQQGTNAILAQNNERIELLETWNRV